MNKYQIKPEFANCDIHTKSANGSEILVNSNNFNDHFAELIIAAGQAHLIQLNPRYTESAGAIEKKTFHQISEGVITLTSDPLPKEEETLKEDPKKRGKRSDAGKPRTPKG